MSDFAAMFILLGVLAMIGLGPALLNAFCRYFEDDR